MTGIDLAIKRRTLGYTQEELARLMGKSRATISRWETRDGLIDRLAVLGLDRLEPKRKEPGI